LEPEGLDTDSVYVNGFSTSLPANIQQKGLNTIPGLEKAKISQYGYAIEYDFFFPYQLQFTLETKLIENLYFAGQINGTSGYEEAAVQGMIAAINAVNKIRSEKPFLLNRSEAYIGVLIDDLVNKSTEEPYRIFTSLAEYRLLLRQDNADIRLMKYGYQFGLIPENVYNIVTQNRILSERCFDLAKDIRLQAQLVNPYLESIGESPIIEPSDLKSLARRPKASIQKLISLLENRPLELNQILENQKALEQLGYEIKYEGYIERQRKEIERYLHNEKKYIPKDFDYSKVKGISNEAREKLIKIRPNSLGQASRISGVSSSDVSVLSIYLR
jgi:tRNA uridine 5-carboxymethylaminomethyl modification enzyme